MIPFPYQAAGAGLVQAVPLGPQATWDPTYQAASITLSNSSKDAEANANNAGLVLSTDPKTTGKFFAEIELVTVSSAGQAQSFGFGVYNATTGLTTYLGGNSNGFGSWVEGSGNVTRSSYNNNVQSNSTSGFTDPSVGTRGRMVVMPGVGIWLGRWGTTAWLGGGDPVAETSPTYALPAGTYRMAVNPRGTARKLRLVDPSNWTNPVSGCSVWGP